MSSTAPTSPERPIASFEEALAALSAEREKVAVLTRERDNLRAAYERLLVELELLRRRIFIAKAERVDTRQLELDFAATLAALDQLAGLTPDQAKMAEQERGGGEPQDDMTLIVARAMPA